MSSRARLEWLEGRLWGLAAAAVLVVVFGFVDSLWHRHRVTPSLQYLRLSRTGRLTTARIEGTEGIVRPRIVYSYTTPDGVRRRGRDDRLEGTPGDEALVFYLPGEPDVSTPLNEWFEFEQLAVAVLLAVACAVSLLSWRSRVGSLRP